MMAHQYSRVGFKSSVEVNEVNLSLSYGGVDIKVYETIHFLNLQDNPINLSPFSLKLDQLENLTPEQRSMTFCYFDLYLENEM